jgi:hypothetical protein
MIKLIRPKFKKKHSFSNLKINMIKIIINKQISDSIVFIYYYRTWINSTVTNYVLMVYTLINLNDVKRMLHICRFLCLLLIII